jgi:ubiquinone/menaquinone biosynthesis C-methylase UbiE
MRFLSPKQVITPLHITPGQKVADFGCGSGHYIFELSEKVTGPGIVYAVDIHKALLVKIAKEAEERNLLNIRTVWADLEQAPIVEIEDSALDIILLSNVLFQVSDKTNLINEILRTLKSGGQVLVIDWKEDNTIRDLSKSKDDIISKETISNLFVEERFTLTQEVEAGYHHHGYIYRKI